MGQEFTRRRHKMLNVGFNPVAIVGKAPNRAGWQDIQATPEAISEWEVTNPVAVNTGINTRHTPAVDIDVYDAGVATKLEQLFRTNFGDSGRILVRTGQAPKRAIPCRTDAPFKKIKTNFFVSPDGGRHRVEILGDGQQLAAFGIHPEINRDYLWEGGEPGDVTRDELPLLTEADAEAFRDLAAEVMRAQPGWVEEGARTSQEEAAGSWDEESLREIRSILEGLYAKPEAMRRSYGMSALHSECDKLASVRGGGRNDALNISAMKMAQLVAAGVLTQGVVFAALFRACERNGLTEDKRCGPRGVRKTILSGFKKGLTEPREIPNGYAGAQDDPFQFEEDTSAPLGEWNAGLDTATIPPRQWLLGNVFCRQNASSLLGDGAVGKTSVRYTQYLSLCTGRALSGDYVHHRSRVMIVSLEDTKDELRRRLAAARIHHGISLSDLDGWLFMAAPGIGVGKILTMDSRGRVETGPLAAKLEEAILKHKIDLVSLDPLVKLHGVDENNNNAMDAVCSILTDLAIRLNIAVDVPHHMNKAAADPGNAKKGRGASSMKDAFRLVYTLQTMTPDEGKEFGIPDEERRFLIRVDSAKVNIAPPADGATWFRLIGVRLGNGNDEYPNGDEVQAVERWTPPKVFADISSATVNNILNDIEGGLENGQLYSEAGAAKARAVWPVVIKHCPTKTEIQAKKVIKAWLASGLLTIEEYDDPKERRLVSGLRVDNSKRP